MATTRVPDLTSFSARMAQHEADLCLIESGAVGPLVEAARTRVAELNRLLGF